MNETTTMPSDGGRKRPRRTAAAVAAGCTVAVLAAGLGGWTVWDRRTLAEASQACARESKTVAKAAAKYGKLLESDEVTAMAALASQDVADAATVDALAEALAAKTPKTASCPTDRAGLAEASEDLSDAAAWYATHSETVSEAALAVGESHVDRAVADGRAKLSDSDGRVADDATRRTLQEAIDGRDADAIAAAVKAVDDSVAAKTRADEEAAQAQQAAQAAQAQASAGSSHAATSGGGSAWAGGGSTWGGAGSGGGSSSQPSVTTGGGGASGGSTSGGSLPWDGMGCETSNSNPSCDTGWMVW